MEQIEFQPSRNRLDRILGALRSVTAKAFEVHGVTVTPPGAVGDYFYGQDRQAAADAAVLTDQALQTNPVDPGR